MRAVAFIPARGGSKGIPRKNLAAVGGRTLVDRAIDVALAAPSIDLVVVSTDDNEIADSTARRVDVHHRPADLAGDQSLVIDAIRHYLSRPESPVHPVLVLIQPTSPFTAVEDIEACVDALRSGRDSAATFTESRHGPEQSWEITDGFARPHFDHFTWARRQDIEASYHLTGGVYAFHIDRLPDGHPGVLFGRVGAVVVPPERAIDIDTPLDLEIARCLAERHLASPAHEGGPLHG